MNRTDTSGLTLIELLVGMALLGIILTALTSFFTQSSRNSVQSSVRAELQQETLNAQQLITARLKEAYYIFPTGTVFALGSGNLRQNPTAATNTGTWKVETAQPILAMVLPPKTISSACTPPTTTTSSEAASGGETEPTAGTGNNNGCYRFFAYYAVKRSQWLSGTSATGSNNPGADANNTDTWVLVEYRDYYYTAPGTTPTSMPPIASPGSTVNRSKAYLLMDYLAPSKTAASPAKPVTTRAYDLFTLSPSSGAVEKVTIKLATVRAVSGKVLRLPSDTNEYSISVTPTNLGKIASN